MDTAAPSLHIRRARPEQAEELTRLAHASKAHWGYPAGWLRAWAADLTFSAGFVRDGQVFAAHHGERAVGVYALLNDGEDCELEHFWVDPGAMGHGVGRRLLEHAAATARTGGALRLNIDSDPHARGFYLKMGARDLGKVPAPMDGAPDRYLPRMSLVLEA